MGLGSLMAGIGAALGSAISSAASSTNKSSTSSNKNGTSSNKSSGSFDKNVDYQAKINQAVAKGDLQSAAVYEQQRNDKINAGYGGGYQTTNKYSQYLPGSSSGSSGGSGSSGSSSSPSSSGASGAGSLGAQMSGTYQPVGVYNDADLKQYFPDVYRQIEQLSNQYEEAQALGDKAGMDKAHSLAEQIRAGYGYSGGTDGSQFLPTEAGYTIADYANQQAENEAIIASLLEAQQQREQQYQQQMESINAQYEAALGQLQANVEAQKQDAAKQTAINNAAAEKAYMTTIKPNGSLAESLAANGLLSSGITESSQIQAGNTYQQNLNNNATTQSELLAELERMAIQAEYTNDLQRLQAIQTIMAQIAETGYANAQDIAALRQWSAENTQNYMLQMQQMEMQRQQLQEDLANGRIDRETAQKQLELLEQQIEAARLQNKYYQTQL